MKWQRIVPFESRKVRQEIWIGEGLNREKRHHVEVAFGKEIDIMSLKINLIENFAKKVSSVRSSRVSTYQSRENLEHAGFCPVCGHSSEDAKKILDIHGANYCRCPQCVHYYLSYRPTEKYLEKFYKTNAEYQSTYADRHTLKTRVEQVVIPKAEYMFRQYKKKYGRMPRAILDVGAGSGHFVYACRKLGVACDGVEISASGRAFCKENFDIELRDADFLKIAGEFHCDVVTFWGLVEHVTRPLEILKSAKSSLGKEGMIVVEVPRWDCFSTAVHAAMPESVVRHLDPMDHIQCFSDSSLATALTLCGFDIVAAWYYGMDAFELLSQLAYRLHENKVIDDMKEKIPIFQESFDLARLSDFMVFVGIPSP